MQNAGPQYEIQPVDQYLGAFSDVDCSLQLTCAARRPRS